MSDDGMTVKSLVAQPQKGQSQPVQPVRAQPQEQPPEQPRVEPKASVVDIEAVAKQLETFLKNVSRSLEFHVDESSGRMVCSVRDAETGDLIRQIPNEEVLRMAELAHDETIVLVNERV
jgi:flagellar protein FlaG